MTEKSIYKLSGYNESLEAWNWRLVEPSQLKAGDVFRIKLGGMDADDVRDPHGNYVFLATSNAFLTKDDDNSEMHWHTKCRPAIENEMRAKCGLPEKMAGGAGVRAGMPEV